MSSLIRLYGILLATLKMYIVQAMNVESPEVHLKYSFKKWTELQRKW